jgi:hypothetical protein
MRKFVPMVLVISMATAGFPLNVLAAQSGVGSLKGIAYRTNLQPFPNAQVQVRNVRTATTVFATTAGPSGEFSFPQLQPDTYIVEIVDATGRIVGMSAPFAVENGGSLTMSVVQGAQGAVPPAGNNAGFSLLGLGPATSLAVLGAAGAVAVTAVVTTRQDASPSR